MKAAGHPVEDKVAGKQAARGTPSGGAGPDGRAPFQWRIQTSPRNAPLAYERLREAILAGQFAPGQRLTEVGIAALLGVSRTPVREAFLRLEAEGLLLAGLSGIEVVDPRGEADDIHLLREAVEGCAARLAAGRATAAEAAGIVALAARTGGADPGDLSLRATLNEQFHLAIAAAAHAPRVERLVREYRSLFASPVQLGRVPAAETRRLLREHTAIAEAVAGRLPDLAERRMREHLGRFRPSAGVPERRQRP